MSRTIFYGPKDVRTIEVRLYLPDTHLLSEFMVYYSIFRFQGETSKSYVCEFYNPLYHIIVTRQIRNKPISRCLNYDILIMVIPLYC